MLKKKNKLIKQKNIIFNQRQVVTLLTQVQENCSLDEAKLLDRVMEFLKREGLYSPQMKEIRTDDPTATDLIGALLTVSFFF